jgi:hypothetical protein
MPDLLQSAQRLFVPNLRTFIQLLDVISCTAGLRVLASAIISWVLHSAASSEPVGIINDPARLARTAAEETEEVLEFEVEELEEIDVTSFCESFSEVGRAPVVGGARLFEFVLVFPEERKSFANAMSYK